MPDPIARLNAALEGRYRVERELGEGGMATVYLADDLRHGRRVALKVLKPELAAIVGAARFLAEIRTTASLQHPHILPLFDSGEAENLLFYVMPHVGGESLRERLDREHQLPVKEAIHIATAVAEALDYAHRRGVIHRDIKPSNILVHVGQPVLSDFGIALAVSAGSAGRLTETGLSLGTPHYMSPEQATGDASVGPATDIYALGCVLYEMLVGEPPYTGSTPQAILGKIITAKPVSATEQRRSVPPNVDAAIRRALEKLPADRFTSASDFAEALANPHFDHGAAAVIGAVRGPWKRISIGLAASTVSLALLSVWAITARPRPEPPAMFRSYVTPGEGRRLVPNSGTVDFALAPDGSWFVYVGEAPGGGRQLWRRALEDLEPVALGGTEGAVAPEVSPDGLSVAFLAAGAIRTVSLQGGPPTTVVAAGGVPAWGSDGMIYFGRDLVTYRVPATGGDPEPFTEALENRRQVGQHPLPDGAGLLLTLQIGTPAEARIAAVGPTGGAVRDLLAGTIARYSATGHIVYATPAGALMAAPFDVRRLEITGPSVPLVEGVAAAGIASQFTLSESGALLYASGAGSGYELVWVSRAGAVEAVDPDWTGELGSPALSPDGSRLAVAVQGPTSMDIWVKQLDRGPSIRLTLDGDRSDYPTWTPDGASVTFTSDRASPSFDLWTKRADGSGEPVLERDEEWALAEAAWSPDGEWLLHRTSTNVRGAGDILGQRRGDPAPLPIVATAFTELAPAISPNGRWLAYSSNETGRTEIFVVPFPNTGDARWLVSVAGGTEPAWSRDGRELFYRSGQGEMVAVRVETDGAFSTGATDALFPDSDYRSQSTRRQYDVSQDGERFILIRSADTGHESQLILVQGFQEELERIGPS